MKDMQTGHLFFMYKQNKENILIKDGVVYKINAYSSAKVVGYTTDINEDVVLPNEIYYNSEMCTIDTISEYAFFNCGNLKSISIPNSIKYIGNNAFSGTDLTSLNIEDGDEPIFLDSNYYPYNEEQVRINGSPYRVSICGFEGTLVLNVIITDYFMIANH